MPYCRHIDELWTQINCAISFRLHNGKSNWMWALLNVHITGESTLNKNGLNGEEWSFPRWTIDRNYSQYVPHTCISHTSWKTVNSNKNNNNENDEKAILSISFKWIKNVRSPVSQATTNQYKQIIALSRLISKLYSSATALLS